MYDYKLWTEIIVLGIHNPPFYSASLAMSDMGLTNIYVMRSEVRFFQLLVPDLRVPNALEKLVLSMPNAPVAHRR
jgi:hypothetical protein